MPLPLVSEPQSSPASLRPTPAQRPRLCLSSRNHSLRLPVYNLRLPNNHASAFLLGYHSLRLPIYDLRLPLGPASGHSPTFLFADPRPLPVWHRCNNKALLSYWTWSGDWFLCLAFLTERSSHQWNQRTKFRRPFAFRATSGRVRCTPSGHGNSSSPANISPDLSSVPPQYHNLGEVFSKSRATSLLSHRSYDCVIDLIAGTSPPRGCLLSLSAPERLTMEKYIGESLAAGLIRPSSSPAGAGFFFVGKKDGTLRPCIDYRGLNAITVKNRYPIPLISSAFSMLQKAHFFTKLDLRNAYHLVRIREGDEWKTAFKTPRGH